MKKVNLRDLYPDVYKTDHFVEVTEDVLETIRDSERAEAAYDRRMYRYKAHYSLDCDNGIENAILSQMRLWFRINPLRAEKHQNGVFWHRFPRIFTYSAPLRRAM